VEGDYLHFGVYQGYSFIVAYDLMREYGLRNNMRLFAFDGFQGLPEGEGNKLQGSSSAPREDFDTAIRRVGMDRKRVRTIEGFFSDSLTDSLRLIHNMRHAAIVYLDCDLYISAKEVLRFIEPIIHPGSIVIFRDWHFYETVNPVDNPADWGEQRAFQEWRFEGCFDELFDDHLSRSFVMTNRRRG